MPFATSTINKFLDAAHGKATYTAPTNVFVGLSTTTPTAAGANVTEPVGNGYARVSVPAASFGVASAGSITNSALIQFATASGTGWGSITHVVVYDALTVGTMLWFDDITAQTVGSGVAPKIEIGQATSSLV